MITKHTRNPIFLLACLLGAPVLPVAAATAGDSDGTPSATAPADGDPASSSSPVPAGSANQATVLPGIEVTGDRPQDNALASVSGFVAGRTATATKTNTSLVEIPQSLTIVTRDEMDKRGVQRLTEAVSYVAGVQSEFQGIDSRNDTLTIRGFKASDSGGSNNVYLDGLRTLNGGQWTRAQFDTFGLERIEVLKGPSAVLFGQVSPGGLVNSVSKRPSVESHTEIGVQASSHNTVQGTLDIGGASPASDKVQFRLVGLVRDGDAEVDHTELRRTFFAPSLSWNPTEKTSITFLAQYQDDSGGSTYQFLPANGTLHSVNGRKISPSTFLGEPDWNNYDRTQYSLGYALEQILNDTFTFRQNFRYTHVETDYKAVVGGVGAVNTTTGMWPRRFMWGTGESDGFAVDTHLQANFDTGPLAHAVLAGIDYFHTDWNDVNRENRLQTGPGAVPPINIFDPVYSGVGNATNPLYLLPRSSSDVTEWQTGVYLQDQASWKNLRATLGARYDWTDNKTLNRLSGVTSEMDPGKFTWRAGLTWLFDNGLAPYASYSTSFEPVSGSTAPARGSNPFDPTEGEQYEVGLKYKPAGLNALFTASVYQLTQTNVSTPDPLYAGYQVQTGEVRIRGVELEGRVSFFKGFDAIATWTWMDSEITKDTNNKGNEMTAVPDTMASLWLDYTLPESFLEGFNVGAGVRYVGKTWGDNTNNPALRVPDYTLFDAAIRYDFGKKFPSFKGASVALTASNLADKTYVATSSAGGGGVAWYGSGRNVSLSFRYAW